MESTACTSRIATIARRLPDEGKSSGCFGAVDSRSCSSFTNQPPVSHGSRYGHASPGPADGAPAWGACSYSRTFLIGVRAGRKPAGGTPFGVWLVLSRGRAKSVDIRGFHFRQP